MDDATAQSVSPADHEASITATKKKQSLTNAL